jgi:hypothetical protein
MIKTQTLSASRAGLGSVVISDPGINKTQAISNVGVVVSPLSAVAPFIIHPFI